MVQKQYEDRHEQDAKRIAELASQSSLRELISYKIFPKPEDKSQQLFDQFGAAFRQRVEEAHRVQPVFSRPALERRAG